MERKKIFRSVWFWVVLVVLLALTFSSFFSGNGGYQEVSTSTALQQFSDGNVEKATINDKEQTLDLDLKKSVEVCTLLRKTDAAQVQVPVRYVGFDIPNEFVIGYGLDYAERYRDLPYIATLRPEVYSS